MSINGRPLNLEELGTGDVRARIEAGADTVLVPLGSVERHGNPFTPLGLDGIMVRAIVERAAAKADVLHTPLMPFGWAPMHVGPPGEGGGAVTLRAETYRLVMEDVARSLIYQGFDKVLFCTLHGPNVDVAEEVLYSLRIETGAFVALYSGRESDAIGRIFESPPARLTSDLECSMAMALLGERFRSEEYRSRAYDVSPPEWMGGAFSKVSGMGTSLEFGGAPNIHVGLDDSEYTRKAIEDPPPSHANAERGDQLLDSLSDHLAEFASVAKRLEVEVSERDWPERAR
jgi:creatinine amidohydrolase